MAEVRTAVAALIAESAGVAPGELGPDTTFEELGFDSLAMTRLRHNLKERLGLWLDEVDLNTTTTMADLALLAPEDAQPA
ncbi:acyl carrier protein [Actinomadura sp. GTD37]|uniref:acyl carrier protein n=1 Tax=Actinomadura sp. GTD37 TaxID=1778030 RepID=UPI0035C26979